VINIQQLIASAVANGDAAKNKNGLHFKLDFSQDPQKHKTFWVSCPAAQPGTPGSQPGSAGTPTPVHGTVPTATPAPTSGAPGGAASTPPIPSSSPHGAVQGLATRQSAATPAGGVLGISTTSPLTGAALPLGLAILLLAGGASLMLLSRRRGGSPTR
jgi:hypothetical protein